MPLEKVALGEGSSWGSQLDQVRRWITLSVEGSGREQTFDSSHPAVTGEEGFRNAGSSMPIEIPTSALNEFIAFELSLVPDVEFVFTAFRNDVFYVWVIVDNFEGAQREHIYERERAIIDEFQSLEFDFYIVARLGRDVRDLVSEGITPAYEKGA